jgi:hypothetical protein
MFSGFSKNYLLILDQILFLVALLEATDTFIQLNLEGDLKFELIPLLILYYSFFILLFFFFYYLKIFFFFFLLNNIFFFIFIFFFFYNKLNFQTN